MTTKLNVKFSIKAEYALYQLYSGKNVDALD